MNFSKYQDTSKLIALSDSWSFRKFDEVLKDLTRNFVKIPTSEYVDSGKFPIVDQGKNLIAGYSNIDAVYEKEVIIFGDHTRALKYINFPFHIGADGVKVLVNQISKEAITKYIYYYLSSINLPNTGYNRHFKYLKELVIPLPEIKIQKRIVKVLEEVESLILKRQSQIVALDELAQSVFLEMFGYPTGESKFSRSPLKSFGKIITGNTPPRNEKDNYGDEIEWIKSDNINTPDTYLTSANEYLSVKGKQKGRIVPPNSILVTCIAGSKSSLGNVALTEREVSFNQQINAVIPENANSYFLYMHFLLGKCLIQNKATNGMKGMVSKGVFQEIEFISPPLSVQNEYGEKFLEIEIQKSKMMDSLKEMQSLYNSLLQKAFRGELFQEE